MIEIVLAVLLVAVCAVGIRATFRLLQSLSERRVRWCHPEDYSLPDGDGPIKITEHSEEDFPPVTRKENDHA